VGSIDFLSFGKFLVFVMRSRFSEKAKANEIQDCDLDDEREVGICH
jgi:hypothetical protein